jgi:hypothetical protein
LFGEQYDVPLPIQGPANARTLVGPSSLPKGMIVEETQVKKPMNKTEIFVALSETTGLTKQQVGSLFDELGNLIGKNLDYPLKLSFRRDASGRAGGHEGNQVLRRDR